MLPLWRLAVFVPMATTCWSFHTMPTVLDAARCVAEDYPGGAHALAALRKQLEDAKSYTLELEGQRDRLTDILSRTAIALKGPEPELTKWSWHDLPKLAEEARKDADNYWNDDDRERNYSSISEFLNDKICNGTPIEVGSTFTLLRAVSLPKITIRVTSVDEEECEADYEIVGAAIDAAMKEQK